MKGWTLQDVQSLMPEEYAELIAMLNDEAKQQRTDLDLND
jgi:hypothetical protein